jgi:hypothetical protein
MDIKDVSKIHQLLTTPISGSADLDVVEHDFNQLSQKLMAKRLNALNFVCNNLNLDIQPDPEQKDP